MKISVILSTYERPQTLRLALLSLSHQTRVPDEVVIHDDGSDEHMASSVRGYVADLGFAGVKYVRQEHRGFRLARSRNNGIRQAEGDYLVFSDQDIVATTGYIEQFSRYGRRGQFLVAFPVLLTEQQSEQVTEEMVVHSEYSGLLTIDQVRELRRQYVKDSFYYYCGYVLGGRRCRPKVRGGVFGISREDLLLVDGFDENYQGWGAEDDDLGRRLYRAGVAGRTVFRNEFPIHLWHRHETDAEDSPNLPYYKRRLGEIRRGDFRAVHGLSNPLDVDEPAVIRIRESNE